MKKILAVIAILSLVFSPVTPAFAAETYVWSGGAGPGNTSILNNDNWEGGQYPEAITDNIIFASGGVTATDDSGNFEMASITFDSEDDFSIISGVVGSFLQINEGGITAENYVDEARNYTISQNVTLGASQTWTVSNIELNTTTLVVSGGISQTGGAKSLTKADDGILILSGTNTYTGTTTVTGGTLTLNYSTNNTSKLSDTAALILEGGTLNLVGGTHTEVVASTTLNPGASSVILSSGTSVLQMNILNSYVGSTINFGAAGIATTDNTNTHGILGGWATVGGTDWAVNSTNGADGSITALASYTEDTWAIGNNTTVTGDSTLDADSTTNSLRFNADGAYTLILDGTNTVFSGGILVTSTVDNNLSTITGGNLQGASGADLVIIQNNTLGALTIGSVIRDNGDATGLTKSGAGELILTGVNLYTGATYVNEGTLTITNNNALGNTEGVEVSDGGILKLDGSGGGIAMGDVVLTLYDPSGYELGALYSAGGDNSWAGDITLAGNAGIEVGSSSTLEITGGISGSYTLNKFGGGELTLNDNSDHTGNTRIVAGTLNINSATAFGTGILLINSGTTIDNTSGRAVTLNNNDQAWESDFTFTGTNDLNLGTGAVDISNDNATITVQDQDSNLTVGGIISDDESGVSQVHSLTKAGVGTLILTGANTYAGDTAVDEGTLIAKSGSALGDGGNVTVALGAGLNYAATVDENLAIGGNLGIVNGATIGGSIGSTTTSAMISVTGEATATGTITVNIYGNNFSGTEDDSNTYTLLQSDVGSLDSADYLIGIVYNNTNFTVGSGGTSPTELTVDIASETALTEAYWTGGLSGAENVWAASNGVDTSNWVATDEGESQALVPGSGADVHIASSGGVITSPDDTILGADMSINSLTIQDTTNGLILNADGNTLTVGDGGIIVENGVPDSTIAADIALGASQTWTVVDSGGTLTVSGIIGDGGNEYSLTKGGGGTLTLSGANNYTGATSITAGILKLAVAGALGNGTNNTSGVTVRDGSVLDLGGITPTANVALNLNGTTETATVGALTNSSATAATYGGAVTLQSNSSIGSSDGDITLSNTISGAFGLTKVGTKKLILTNDTNGTTTTTITAGTLQIGSGGTTGVLGIGLVTNDGNLTINRSNAFTIGSANAISGSGSFTQNGRGTTTLSAANAYAGGTTINAGTLQVSNADAVGGAGGGALTNNGTLDIGLTGLNVGGIYMQNAGKTLNLSASSASSYGKIITSASKASVADTSVFNITVSGYIANGATLSIINGAAGSTYNDPSTYTINVLGDTKYTFAGSAVNGDLVFTASRAMNGFASDAGGNSNGAGVGQVLDNITNATGDMLNVLNTLDAESSGNVGNALGTMTPDVSSGAAEGSRNLTSQGFTTVSNRLGGARNGGSAGGISSGDTLEGIGVWMQALGSHMKQDTRKGIEGYMANLFGTTVGADKVLDDHFRAGFAGSYGWARVKSKTAGSPSDDINSYQATVYGSFDSLDLNKARQGGKRSYEAVRSQVENSWYVDGMFAFTQNNYDSRREIWAGGTDNRVAKADHYGQQYSTNFEAGYKFVFEKTKALEVTPFMSLGYNYLYMNKYKEKGADSLNLNVNGEGFSQLEQGLGTKLAYPIVCKKMGTFIPSAKAAWLYDYIGDRFETTASFAGGGASFNTTGAKPAKSGMLFGAELAFLDKGNMTVTGNWDIELKDQFMSNTYYGTVRYDF